MGDRAGQFRRGGEVPHEPVLERWAMPRSAAYGLVGAAAALLALWAAVWFGRGGAAGGSIGVVGLVILFLYVCCYRSSLTLTADHLVLRNVRTWQLDRADLALARPAYYGVEILDRAGGRRRCFIANSRVWWSRGMPDAGTISARINTWAGLRGSQPWHWAEEPRPAYIPPARDADGDPRA